MALEINTTIFDAFVNFARTQEAAGRQKAIARVDASELGGIANRTIKPASGDWVGIGAGRLKSLKNANNAARDLFRKGIADMFGGENHIPDSVKDAMKMQDYGKGKPLTARRILAVKAAIEKDGTIDKKLGTFDMPESAEFAKAKGWSTAELPKIARAAHFLSSATGLDELTAIAQLSTPGTKENRLLHYGGRFLESASNFKEGLRLLDNFGKWFAGLGRQDGEATPSRINVSTMVTDGVNRAAFERIVFDFIANNDKIDLTSHDNEAVFGMKGNPASRFVGLMMHTSCLSTFMNVPPRERNVLLAVFCQLAEVADSEQGKNQLQSTNLSHNNASPVLRRALWHLDELAALHDKGQLTPKNIITTCFPDMPKPDRYNGAAINKFLNDLNTKVYRQFSRDPGKLAEVANAVGFSGLPLKDILEAIDSGRPVPQPKYVSSGEAALNDITDATEGARKSLAGDLVRPNTYSMNGQKLGAGIQGFGFNFPGKERLVTNGSDGKGNIKPILDDIESLCGKPHVRQSQAVMNALSQSGISANMVNLLKHGVETNEHAPVEFSLSRNDETGDVTIRYSSPASLPFAFEWTATISTEGNVTTTPLRFTDEKTLNAEMSAAANKLKGRLTVHERDVHQRDMAIDTLLGKAKTDRDLLALLTAGNANAAHYILMDPDGGLRTEAEATKRLEALRDNLNELRTAANGDKRVIDSGIKQLALFNGKALKSGIIAKMCEIIAKEDVGAFKGLSANSSPEKLLEAMCRLDRMVVEVCKATNVMKTFHGVFGAEGSNVNSLILGLFFGRCDEQTLNGLKDAIYSGNSCKLQNVMDELKNGAFPPGTRLRRAVRVANSQMAAFFGGMFRSDMAVVVNNTLGIEEFYAPPMPEGDEVVSQKSRDRMVELIKEQTQTTHPDLIVKAQEEAKKPIVFKEL